MGKIEVQIEWNDPEEHPGQLSQAQNGFSVDVLIDAYEIGEHQIGWFDFKMMKWHFLCNEQHIERFKWRYFNNSIDNH